MDKCLGLFAQRKYRRTQERIDIGEAVVDFKPAQGERKCPVIKQRYIVLHNGDALISGLNLKGLSVFQLKHKELMRIFYLRMVQNNLVINPVKKITESFFDYAEAFVVIVIGKKNVAFALPVEIVYVKSLYILRHVSVIRSKEILPKSRCRLKNIVGIGISFCYAAGIFCVQVLRTFAVTYLHFFGNNIYIVFFVLMESEISIKTYFLHSVIVLDADVHGSLRNEDVLRSADIIDTLVS